MAVLPSSIPGDITSSSDPIALSAAEKTAESSAPGAPLSPSPPTNSRSHSPQVTSPLSTPTQFNDGSTEAATLADPTLSSSTTTQQFRPATVDTITIDQLSLFAVYDTAQPPLQESFMSYSTSSIEEEYIRLHADYLLALDTKAGERPAAYKALVFLWLDVEKLWLERECEHGPVSLFC